MVTRHPLVRTRPRSILARLLSHRPVASVGLADSTPEATADPSGLANE